MLVSEFMQHAAARCSITDNLKSVARTMLASHTGFLVVVDLDGAAVGVITDRDVCMAAAAREELLDRIAVSETMSPLLHAVREGDVIAHAEDLMRLHHVHRLPVVDGGGRPVGVLTLGDLARAAAPGWCADAGGVTPSSVVHLLSVIDEGRHCQ